MDLAEVDSEEGLLLRGSGDGVGGAGSFGGAWATDGGSGNPATWTGSAWRHGFEQKTGMTRVAGGHPR